MEIIPKYIPFKKRLFRSLIKIFIGLLFVVLFVLVRTPGKLELTIVLVIVCPITGFYIYSFYEKCKYYLSGLKIKEDSCEFVVFKYDKIKETHKTKLSETRIKIVMLLFPFTHFGTSYKLVIETKKGIKYHVLIEQYEVGDWHLDKFKDAIILYGKEKGVPVSPQSYKRTMF